MKAHLLVSTVCKLRSSPTGCNSLRKRCYEVRMNLIYRGSEAKQKWRMLSDKNSREKKESWKCLPRISTGKTPNKELSGIWLSSVFQPRFIL